MGLRGKGKVIMYFKGARNIFWINLSYFYTIKGNFDHKCREQWNLFNGNKGEKLFRRYTCIKSYLHHPASAERRNTGLVDF